MSWNLCCISPSVTPQARFAALEWLTRRHLLTSVGQTEEIVYLRDGKPLARDRYFQEISSRISVLSFSGPLVLPAICAGADRRLSASFDELGKYLGLAYHLHGDELNLFPRSEEWGKATGDDITSGTQTYLLASALQTATPAGRRVIISALGSRTLSRRRLQEVIEIIRNTGAAAKNRKAIDYLSGKATAIINSTTIGPQYKTLLRDCLRYMAYDRNK